MRSLGRSFCIGGNEMASSFFEVFPTLQLSEGLRGLLSGVTVEKVSANRGKTSIRIYLFAEHLIPKDAVFRLEREIKKQLFRRKRLEIKIIEKFRLSGQYTAKKLMDAYGESIAEELKAYSLLLYNVRSEERRVGKECAA